MKKLFLIITCSLMLIAIRSQAQEASPDSITRDVPEVQSNHASDDASASEMQTDTVQSGNQPEVDTTSTRTFGTAPGTGTTGAGSGNGDAAGNTGTPGSDTMKDDKKGDDDNGS